MKINGNLQFHTLGQGELRNAIIERLSSAPSEHSAGRIYFNTTDGKYWFSTGTVWVQFATGGDATALQNEVDAIETTLGGMVNGSGVFQASAFSGFTYVTAPTSLTNVLSQLDAALNSNNTLAELDDVTFGTLSTGQFLMKSAGNWVNHTLVAADLSDVTATATELNYVDGVTSAIQTQLDNKQPLDGDLTTIAGFTHSDGNIMVSDGSGWVLESGATARASLGVSIGSQVQAWDADLDDIAAFAPADGDFIVGTGGAEGARWVLESGATVRASLGLTIGTNVQAYDADLSTIAAFEPAAGSAEPNGTTAYDFMFATGTTEGSRWTIGRGSVARNALGLGDIATMDDTAFIRANNASSNVAMDITWNNYKITNLGPGTSGTDAVNKNQLDAAVAGLSWKQAVKAATTADLTLSGAQTVDGVSLVAGDRVLVKNQATGSQNGIYVVAAGAWTRSTDADAAAELEGAAVFVQQGTVNADSSWTQTADGVTLGTTALTWSQFAGTLSAVAGIGLIQNGNQLDVRLGAGIVELPSDEVGIDLYDPNTSALILTEDATTRGTGTNAKLHLLLAGSTLTQGATGLKVASTGITATELNTSVAGAGLSGGAGTALAVNVDGSTIEITGDSLNVKDAGITNAKLQHSTFTIAGSTGTDAVALGETLTFVGGSTPVTAAVTANTVTISVADASTTAKGLAQFDSGFFSVASGVVSLASTLDDLTNVSGADSTAAGNVLVKTAGDWQPITPADFAFTFELKHINDVSANNPQVQDTLMWTGSAWSNTKIFHKETITVAATTWTIDHSLQQQHVNVTVYDSTNNVIIPESIVATDASTTTITFNAAITGTAVIMGLQ